MPEDIKTIAHELNDAQFTELCARYFLKHAKAAWDSLNDTEQKEILETYPSAEEWILDTAGYYCCEGMYRDTATPLLMRSIVNQYHE